MEKFVGDLSSLWRLNIMPPIPRLSWWWYWVIMYVPDPDIPTRSRQLMILWSTKETPAIRVSGHWWNERERFAFDYFDVQVEDTSLLRLRQLMDRWH